jgi:hypothetical protein
LLGKETAAENEKADEASDHKPTPPPSGYADPSIALDAEDRTPDYRRVRQTLSTLEHGRE